MIFTAALVVITMLLISVYVTFKYKHSYWKRRGVPASSSVFPFGHLRTPGRRDHLCEVFANVYNKMKGVGPFCGMYFFHRPAMLALEPDFIKKILIKDFHMFQERGVYVNEAADPLAATLFNLEAERWRPLRAKLSATFTSGKLKFMFPAIVDVANKFHTCLSGIVGNEGCDVEIKDLLARFSTDTIGACAFGVECNSLNDPNAEFRLLGKKIFESARNTPVKLLFFASIRRLAIMFGRVTNHDDVAQFFMGIVRETIKQREMSGAPRNDFIDLLIEIKNEGAMGKNVSLDEAAAQAFVFFMAGFEISSTTLSFALFELSQNKSLQVKAREEIKRVLAKHNGNYTYDAMMEMHYIDNIISESLRKYPPISNLLRYTKKPYYVPEYDVTIEPETFVVIPTYGIHHDPEYYPDPEKFDPERFTPEMVQSRPNCTNLSFGEGPRNCIGQRFGQVQARIGLVTLLRNFEFDLSPKTQVPLKIINNANILAARGGMYMKMSKSQNPF